MCRLGDLIVHADVLVAVGLGGVAGDGGSVSWGSIGGEVVNHFGIELLDSLGLATARVATTGSTLSTAGSLLGGSGVLVVLLGLGGGSGGLRAGLLTVEE